MTETDAGTGGSVIDPAKATKVEETETPQASDPVETVETVEPIEEGVLEKHAHNAAFAWTNWDHRYFVFGDESKIPHENLRQYHKKFRKTIKVPGVTSPESKETPAEDKATTSAAAEENIQAKDNALHVLSTNIAHATQTGKGLLFYYKNKGQKEPLGIINLKFVKSVESTNTNTCEFKITTEIREYVLRADNETNKKRWINTIQTKSKESKEFPLPDTEEFRNVYSQVSQDRFLRDVVTSDSENYTSGEDGESKKRNKYLSFIPGRKPEKTEKTETTATTTTATATTTTTTTTEVTETVEGGSGSGDVVTTVVNTTTSETTEEVNKPEGRRPSTFFNPFQSIFGKKTTDKEKEKVEGKEGAEVVESETVTTTETKEEEVTKTVEEDSKVTDKDKKKTTILSSIFKPKETTTVVASSSTTTETATVEKAEEAVETTPEKTETPTTAQKFFRFWKKDDSQPETTKVEAAEQTEITKEVVEETAGEATKTTEVTQEVTQEITENVEKKTEEDDEVKPESSTTNTKKTGEGLFRRVTLQVFGGSRRKNTTEENNDATREIKEAEEKETTENTEVVAGSSTEKKEETVEEKKEEVIEDKKEKPSLLKRLSKQAQISHPEETKPETQPTSGDVINTATEATDGQESENVILKNFENPRKHGHLEKFANRLIGKKQYETRYFVFAHDGSLYYFKNEKDSKSEQKKIEINHDTEIDDTNKQEKQYTFQIKTKSKTYELAASSEEERDEWIKLLKEHKDSIPKPEEQPSSSKGPDEVTGDKAEEKPIDNTEAVISEEKTKEITEDKTEDKTEEKTEEKVEEEKVEEKVEDKTEDKAEDKTEVKTEEKVEKITEEKTEDKPEKIIEEKIEEEKIEENN